MCRVILAGVLLAGCLHTAGGKAGASIAGIGAASGLIYGIACADYTSSEHHCESTDAELLGGAILIALVGGTVLAIVSEVADDAPVTRDEAPAPVPQPDVVPNGAVLYEPIAARDPLAHQFAIQAHTAAQRGQCAGVPGLATRVRALDAEYYARVFVPDPPIARCMQ